MDELAYRRYCDRGKAADDIFRAVRSELITGKENNQCLMPE